MATVVVCGGCGARLGLKGDAVPGSARPCPRCGAAVVVPPLELPDDEPGDPLDFTAGPPRPAKKPAKLRLPFRFSTPKEIAAGLAVLLGGVLLVYLAAGLFGHGSELRFNGGHLYYTSKVTRAEAERLGLLLVREGFFDGEAKTVQLTKEGRTYQVRLVVKKGLDSDQAYIALGRQMAAALSREVFGGSPTELHYCDDGLSTLRVVPAL